MRLPSRIVCLVAGLTCSMAAAAPAALAVTAPRVGVTVRPMPMIRRLGNVVYPTPPDTATCLATVGRSCYSPAQLQKAYDLGPVYAKGFTGRGSTIVIVDPFGSPTAKADLKAFDKAYGLADPPHFDIIQPAGKVPAFDPTDDDMVGWAEETSLDLQQSHAMAPGANILLVETPVSETEGVQGFPEIVKAENYVIDHHLGDVISQSFGATEDTFPTAQSLLRLRSAFKNAAANGIPVLGSSGDSGVADVNVDGDYYLHKVNSWPSSDPLVTSIGGLQLHLDAKGNRIAPDNVWNETARYQDAVAGGGGLSEIFARPSFQNVVKPIVGKHRGTPDVSLSASVDGGAIVRLGFASDSSGITPGYYVFGGTSEGAPQFAGILAIARQRAGHPIYDLNQRIYTLGAKGAPGLVDVTKGDNTVSFTQDDKDYTIKGYAAVPGYDLSSGWGGIDARSLTKELAR